MKKNIYFVQVSSIIQSSKNSIYLPYSVGSITAYAQSDSSFSKLYRVAGIIFSKVDIDASIASLKSPFAVAFSCYIWNNEYSKAYAKRLRELVPDVKIIFGGHNLLPEGKALDELSYVDITVNGEGEKTFTELMLAYGGMGDISDVKGISYRGKDGQVRTTENRELADITNYPSPYLTGVFDDIMTNNSDYSFPIVWETNRGCPNKCAFCDWGTIQSKVRFLSMDRIKKEIEWMAKNKIEYIYGADANFGMFPRDSEIADLLIKSRKETGYPCKFKMNYSIFKNDNVFEIAKKLKDNGIGKYLSLSFQSLSPEVCKNIGRSNIDIERFRELIKQYSDHGIPVYSELIMGLPGETYDSFTDGIDILLSCNQHTHIAVYPCELLPNSRLGSDEFITKYRIVAKRKRYIRQHSSASNSEIPERSKIIVATSTLSLEGWLKTYMFVKCIHTFHNFGLLRVAAVYAFVEKLISYKAFYERFIDWCASLPRDTVTGSVFAELDDFVRSLQHSETPFYRTYEGMGDILWAFDEYAFTKLMMEKEKFYDEVDGFLSEIESDAKRREDLIKYQNAIIKSPGNRVSEADLLYDFHSFFRDAVSGKKTSLKKDPVRLRFTDTKPVSDKMDFVRQNVWYGRMDDTQLFIGVNSIVERLPSILYQSKEKDKVLSASHK